ncbi:MAG: GTP 3',8-cyclase MoaA, partial [Planctomycetota bacterium]
KVRLTGGEPLLHPSIIESIGMLADEGVPDLSLTTNAQLLAPLALDLKKAGLMRVNISLDTLDGETYRWLTRGGRLATALEGVRAARQAGLDPVKLNVTVLEGVNTNELVELVRFGATTGCEVRFLELMPIGPAAESMGDWFVPSATVQETLAESYDLLPAIGRAGGTSRDFLARGPGGECRVGFISSRTAPFCNGCRRLRLTSKGKLLGCLARADGFDLRSSLHDGASDRGIAATVQQALDTKRRPREFTSQKLMVEVGG